MTSGLLTPLSTALFKMVVGVVVVQREGVREVVGTREVLVARATTRLTASPTIWWNPVVMFVTGLAVVSETTWSAGKEVVETVVVLIRGVVVLATKATTLSITRSTGDTVVEAMLVSSASSKILDGWKPPASISGSHITRIGAITENLEGCGV